MADDLRRRFWELPLADLTVAEWEALCDGCGRCCLLKIEYENPTEILYTNVGCKLLDGATCRCSDYANRKAHVPDCIVLTRNNIGEIAYWMPATCAYRLRHEGQPLADWHPLLSGDPHSVVEAGISMAGRVVAEAGVDEDDLEDHVIEDMH